MPLLTELIHFWIWFYKYVAPTALELVAGKFRREFHELTRIEFVKIRAIRVHQNLCAFAPLRLIFFA